ncbi:hypothetical protein N7499_008873 [Penicillium canescens]|nr:hypothetical protein N7499_008873 [Penicillium canescens]KAJ6159201.1 hypothetical protein N7485_012027 [Penicillium canescens]
MPITATVLRGPLGPSTISSHPILSWYAKYAVDFDTAKVTTSPLNYYASTATLVNPDNSAISGAQQIWDYYIALYGQFERCGHEVISVTVLSNDQTEKHTLIVEVTTLLTPNGGTETVPLPQAFVYEIAEAEQGHGTDGLQIWSLRCYFDKGVLQNAAGV